MPEQNPPNVSEDSGQPHMIEQHFAAMSGPLPPSAEIERYESAMPGAAERIFSMAESEQRHRHEQERLQADIDRHTSQSNVRTAEANIRMQDGNLAEVRRGQWMAFTLALLYLIATVFLGYTGHEVAASAMGLGGIAAVATVFIRVRRKQ